MENLNLLPQKHEIKKCTYADPVGDMQFVGYFCISEEIMASDVFFFSVYWQYLPQLSAM